MMRDITVAAVCMHSDPEDVEGNLERMETFVAKAISQGAEIICFPELSLSGYVLNNPAALYGASRCNDMIARVNTLAKDSGAVVMAGLIEVGNSDGPYISQVVAGPGGVMGIYRKTHLSPMEQGKFQEGHEIKVFEYDGVVFGVQLCWEAHFPEISTIMALQGAEIIFIPHASPRTGPQEKLDSWLRHMRSRAFDNALYIVACNQVGQTSQGYVFPGVAVVIEPSGHVMAQRAEEEEGVVVTILKADKLNHIKGHPLRYFLPSRRPELYQTLVSRNQ